MEFLEAIHQYFGKENVTTIDDHPLVFLCEKKNLDNKTYQIVYIDTTDSWCKPDYSQYLESMVIDKYYQTEGFLQWNFYYYFIATKEIIEENSLRKIEVENDETYSRKSILTEEEYKDWINSFNSISDISQETISKDLYTNWVNYLREKKLYFIYDDKYANYKQPIEDYINGIEFNDKEEIETTDSNVALEPTLEKVKRLELLSFRDYPLVRDFNLGDVNLIHGANAVGKTSFFDAIELIITGEISSKSTGDNFNIQLTDGIGSILKYPTRPSPYKKRDADWYNSGATRGNDLNRNFNKFNYYTSDAAFQLKQDVKDEKHNLESKIADIALGREVNKLEERIIGFNERFTNLSDIYLKDLNRLNDSLKEKNDTIRELSKLQKNPEAYKNALLKSLENNFWKPVTIENEDNFIVRIENEIKLILDIISNIKSKDISLEEITKDTIDADLKSLKAKQNLISEIRKEILSHQNLKQECLKSIEKNDKIIPLINELADYYKNENLSFLFGLDKNIKEKNVELKKSTEIKELSDSVFSNEFLSKDVDKSKSIAKIEEDIKFEQGVLSENYSETQGKIKELESGIEELSIIISNIKSSGQSYIKLDPQAEDCPLCNTHFTENGLVDAIQKTQHSFKNSVILIELKEDLASLKKRLDQFEDQAKILYNLKRLALLVLPSNGLEKTVTEIKGSCEENHKLLNSLTESLINLNTLQAQFETLGFSEDKFTFLQNRINEQLLASIKSATDLDSNKEALLKKQTELTANNALFAEELIRKEQLLNSYFTAEMPNEDLLSKRLNILLEIENNFKQLDIYLTIPSETLLLSISESATAVKSVFETYKKEYFESKEHSKAIEITKKEIEKVISQIEKDIKPKQTRAQFAKDELNTLLREQNKSQYLREYISNNKIEIVSIFKLIHTPREFKDIDFSDKNISLITNSDEPRSLSEISTGQRSALALSIFLSLNKKLTKGPNILIFDDPVTYVDDMNILSFFDYLRELVIKSKRQVFFATANEDLAFLFKKKFDFLGDQLITHNLKRKVGSE